jgi:hypothetical protein
VSVPREPFSVEQVIRNDDVRMTCDWLLRVGWLHSWGHPLIWRHLSCIRRTVSRNDKDIAVSVSCALNVRSELCLPSGLKTEYYELNKNKPKWLVRNNVSEEPSPNIGFVKGEHCDDTVKQSTTTSVQILIHCSLSFSYLIWRYM